MRVRDYIAEVVWEIIYLVVTVVYLFRLGALNRELLSCDFGGAFELLQYRDCAPLKFFWGAVILFLIGCFLVNRGIRRTRTKIETFEEMVVSCLAILLMVVLLVLIIVFINNPILRAVFVTGLVILGLTSVNK